MRSSLLSLPRGFDRDLKLLLFSMATRRISMGFLGVVRAIYFALLGFSPITIGLLFSVATISSAFHYILFGTLSDRYGRKPFLLLGSLFDISRLIIFAMTQDFWLLALGQGLGAMGEGVGAGQPVVSGYITDKVKARRRVSIFSTLAITNAVATSIGSAMAGMPQFFQNLLGMDLVSAHVPLFLIGAVFSSLSFILLLPIKDESSERGRKVKEDDRVFSAKSWSVIMKFSLVRSTSGLGWGLIDSLLPLYFFIRFNVGSNALGPVFATARLISIFTYSMIPFFVSKLGEVGTITCSRILSAVVAVIFAFTDWYALAAVLLIIFRLLMMFTMPIRQSFATGIVDPDETATAIGISNFTRMGARSAASTLAGYMFEALSLSTPFFLGAALVILNGLLYHIYFREHKRED